MAAAVGPEFAARKAIGAVVVLGSGMGEVKDSDLAPGSGLVVVGEESWGAAGGGAAGLGQGGGAADAAGAAGGEGGGLAAAGPGQGGGDAVRRVRSATWLGKQMMLVATRQAAVQEQTNNKTRGRRQGKVQEGGSSSSEAGMRGRAEVMRADGCARRRCSLGEEQGLEREGR